MAPRRGVTKHLLSNLTKRASSSIAVMQELSTMSNPVCLIKPKKNPYVS